MIRTDFGMGGTVPPIGGTICKEENCAKCQRTLEFGGGGVSLMGGTQDFLNGPGPPSPNIG